MYFVIPKLQKTYKCTSYVKKNVIALMETSEVKQIIQKQPFLILLNELTDITVICNLCVCVLFRFVHQISSNVQIRLLELNYLNTTGGSDSNIFKQFEECLKTKSIEYSDFKYYRHGIRRGICSVW